jgi:4-diphosphocytidyl-2-C-methyl-D-erythritol kinase
VEVATADVFKSLGQRRGTGLPIPGTAFADVRELVRYLEGATNDLQAPATRIAPIVNEVLKEIGKIPEVMLARMSGSGATCFGLVENPAIARGCADKLRKDHPDWWVVDTSLLPAEDG